MHIYIYMLAYITVLLATSLFSHAQSYDPLHPPNTYQGTDNPHYWQNDPPHPGYWQQDVHYRIQADLDEATHVIDGELELTYWNHSPDTLTEAYFHLYQNAFQPGSYYENLNKHNKRNPAYGVYEKDGLGTLVEKVQVNSKDLETALDNTILNVQLPEPLPPGDTMHFYFKFKTFFDDGGTMRRRMKMFNVYTYDTLGDNDQVYQFKHYNGVHWYPRICAYDRKFGWHVEQHLDKEFYPDYGTFDVALTTASNYVVGATGYLTNREEVLPPDLRGKLELSNFKDKPRGAISYAVTPYDPDDRKTWKYHAENVHDFAFTADPNYRIGVVEKDGIRSIALAQESNASGWQHAAAFTSECIDVYNRKIGQYIYHKMIVADARDGMEYPMLTLDSGTDPGHRGLLAHEVAHNWFFGMIGTNETYRAAMDEGFTQLFTALALESVDGKNLVRSPERSAYAAKFRDSIQARYYRAYYGYLRDAITGKDHPLNTQSSKFNGNIRHGGGYRQVYYKMATLLFNLQYVLGETLFYEAMQHYFEQWKIAHPYFEDFRSSIIRYTGVDLNWFFDQWFETTKTIDYAVKSVRKGAGPDEYLIKFKRKGRMEMPIDFRVTDKAGNTHDFHIPNREFVKATDAEVLPKWYGWDRLQPTYEASITIPEGIKDVEIDPSQRLADVHMLNNRKQLPVSVAFDAKIWNLPKRDTYELRWRPDIWYNSYDGFKTGLHLNGNHMGSTHKLHATVWYNTGLLQGGVSGEDFGDDAALHDLLSFNLRYRTRLHAISDRTFVDLNGRWLDGLRSGRLRFEQALTDPFALSQSTAYFNFLAMYRPNPTDLNYLLYPGEWDVNRFNNLLTMGLEHRYQYPEGRGDIDFNINSSSLFSSYDFAFARLSVINRTRLGKLDLRTRVFGQIGTGNNVPRESALYLAGANPQEMMANKYVRSRGFYPNEWLGFGSTTNHFHYGGGLNLRGYSGYLVVQEDAEGNSQFVYRGRSGAAVNVELEFDRLIGWKPGWRWLRETFALTPYLFGDAGTISFTQPGGTWAFSDVRMDAGAGAALTIKKFGPLETVNPLTIRFDVPVFLNRPPHEEEFLFFRWMLGVERAF